MKVNTIFIESRTLVLYLKYVRLIKVSRFEDRKNKRSNCESWRNLPLQANSHFTWNKVAESTWKGVL